MNRPQETLSRGESVEVVRSGGGSNGGEALPKGWAMSPIEDFAKTATGGTPSRKRDDYYGGKIAWVKSGDLTDGLVTEVDERITQLGLDESNAKMFPKGAVCIALYGATVGKLGVLDMDASTNQAVCGIFPEDGIDTQFVFHALKNERANLIGKAQGGAQPNISNGIIKKTELRVAPSAEQSRIVSAIESLQERSSRARVLLSEVGPLIGQLRQSVLRGAFSGRLTADWRAAQQFSQYQENTPQETASELLHRIRTERRQRWESEQLAKYESKGKQPPQNWQDKYKEPVSIESDEPLPELPASWAWASVDELTELITSGSRAWTKYYNKGDGTFIMAQNVRPGKLDFSKERQLVGPPPEGDSDRKRSQVEPGDLLVTIVGANTGDICPVEVELAEHWVCQSVALIRLVLPEMYGHVLRYFLPGGGGRVRFDKVIYGQGRPHLGFDDLRAMPVPIPPLKEQAALLSVIEEQEAAIDDVLAYLAPLESSLTQLDQSILSKAFRGELVPQDPRDEPASVLLARIRRARATKTPPKKTRRGKQATTT